ncbi:uncharacterized protein MONBRDRAFT_31027 [Monosiga brevicollis MX1]|uniref:Protein kinase domain-containing protein n=1 Tax=Monosiga brevicollis TaxID=81824 RepID=A9UQT5_MONBE|nr:uncharacterized protein MONBRDRAFT_31027 [Monosiga brevicollis MX1]EDQ92655.1 predicted protein [Monosiga brevicollis MX1]|eukprot:XP_001742417.1 hypothetical protein [Monosiga brevicollis MX1]
MGNTLEGGQIDDSRASELGQTLLQDWQRQFDNAYCNPAQRRSASVQDFEQIKTVGTGSFGRVLLCKYGARNTPVALKILAKATVIQMKQVEHTVNEKNILQGLPDFPFIARLHASFQNPVNLYMALEYVPGGELFNHLRHQVRYAEPQSLFYASQIVLAFEFLHGLQIMYRDLKPENLLFTAEGYLKLCDFGFAKRVLDKTWTMCGTPEYLAPEILHMRGYTKAVDFWALGVLIYEMTAVSREPSNAASTVACTFYKSNRFRIEQGYPPFYAETPMEIYRKILKGQVRWPSHFSQDLITLLSNLLQPDITKRIGCLRRGVTEIKEQAWFEPIVWSDIFLRRVPAPYTPTLSSDFDTRNYDQYPEDDIAAGPDGIDPVDLDLDAFQDF